MEGSRGQGEESEHGQNVSSVVTPVIEDADSLLWRLVDQEKWHDVAARLSTCEGKAEAKVWRDHKLLCHDETFLSRAPFFCIQEFGRAYPEGWGIPMDFIENEDDSLEDDASQGMHSTRRILEYPLHLAAMIENPRNPSLVYHIFQMAPSAIKERNAEGDFPLHVACKHNVSTAIEALLSLYPKAAFENDNNDGNLPLHMLLYFSDTSASCIRQLLDTNPGSAKVESISVELPLYTIVRCDRDLIEDEDYDWDARREAVAMILKAYPRATGKKCILDDSKLPIHVAARDLNHCPDIIEMLYKENPKSIHVRDDDGKLPIDLMLESLSKFSRTESMDFLLPKKNKAGLKGTDQKEISALHQWLREALHIREPSYMWEDKEWEAKKSCWENYISSRLIEPFPKSLTIPSGQGAFALNVPSTDFFFLFLGLFRQMALANPEHLFKPHFCPDPRFPTNEEKDILKDEGRERSNNDVMADDESLAFEEDAGDRGEGQDENEEDGEMVGDEGDVNNNSNVNLLHVTPVARIWRRLAYSRYEDEYNDEEYDVVQTLQLAYKLLQKKRTTMKMSSSFEMEEQIDSEDYKEESFIFKLFEERIDPPKRQLEVKIQNIPIPHLACFFAAAMCPSDFGHVIQSFLKPIDGWYGRTSFLAGDSRALKYERYFEIPDRCGNLPFHHLCASYESLYEDDRCLDQANKKLLEKKKKCKWFPESPLEKGAYDSCFRMFCAIILKHKDRKTLVKMAKTKNKHGELPIHLALKRKSKPNPKKAKAEIEDLKYLLTLYPESVAIPNPNFYHLYPFMIAAAAAHDCKQASTHQVDKTFILLQRFVAEQGFLCWTNEAKERVAECNVVAKSELQLRKRKRSKK